MTNERVPLATLLQMSQIYVFGLELNELTQSSHQRCRTVRGLLNRIADLLHFCALRCR
jgi:hypothetical protein